MKSFANFRNKQLNEAKQDHRKDPPATLVLRRQAIRTYPDGKRVALYYARDVEKYISIPYGDGTDPNVSVADAVDESVDESKMDLLLHDKSHDYHSDMAKYYDAEIEKHKDNPSGKANAERKKSFHEFMAKRSKGMNEEVLEEAAKKAKKSTATKAKKPKEKIDNVQSLTDGYKFGRGAHIKFSDGTKHYVPKHISSAIMNIHGMVKPENRKKIEQMIHKDKTNFDKIASFALGVHSRVLPTNK